VVKKL